MNKQISPNQLADKKAMLMAQLDSLTPEQLPERVSPDLIKQALRLYNSFHFFARNNHGIEVIKNINYSIFCNASVDKCAFLDDPDILMLTSLCDFMVENVDILQEYVKP